MTDPKKPKINWYEDEVMLAVKGALNLEGIALRVEERTKLNIVDNDQIDTGFMLNSTYYITENSDNYAQAKREAESKSADSDMAPQAQLKDPDSAAVVVGAEYAIYQEMQKSFLLKAVEDTAAEIDGIVKPV